MFSKNLKCILSICLLFGLTISSSAVFANIPKQNEMFIIDSLRSSKLILAGDYQAAIEMLNNEQRAVSKFRKTALKNNLCVALVKTSSPDAISVCASAKRMAKSLSGTASRLVGHKGFNSIEKMTASNLHIAKRVHAGLQ